MDKASEDRAELEERRERLRAALASAGEMRPGSLVEYYRKCGKPNCHCAKRASKGHGPSWILTRAVGGKTLTRSVPAQYVERTRAQIEEHRRFREVVHDFVEVNAQLCESQAQDPTAVQAEEKKGGSKQPSRKRSSPKSKRS
jgi:hypothetical protein